MKLHSGVWAYREALAVLEYVAASASTKRPISSAGFDCQFASPDSSEAVVAFLTRVVPDLDPDARQEIGRAVAAGRTAPALDEQARSSLQGCLQRLRDLIRRRRNHPDASEDVTEELRVLDGVIADLEANGEFTSAREPWMARLMTEAREQGRMPKPDLSDPEFLRTTEIRDTAMGINLARLADEVFPGRRIVGWLATAHAALDLSVVEGEYRGWTSAGGVARDRLGEDVFSVAITAHHGETGLGAFHEVGSLGAPSADSVEAILYDVASPHAYANLRGLAADHALRGRLRSRLLNNEELFASDWSQVVDAVFLIDEMRLPTPLST